MKARWTFIVAACTLLTLAITPSASAGDRDHDGDHDGRRSGCERVSGQIIWSVIPAANDPFGRVLGSISGSLEGATTDTITAFLAAGPDGITTSDLPIFWLGPNDIITATSIAKFTTTSNPDVVNDEQTITITGGTGKYAGATGTIAAKGKGHFLFPAHVVGQTFFKVDYAGEVCVPSGH
jgi:hypothetical protein